MHFSPYTRKQIIDIFTKRLNSGGVADIFAPQALQMLASKVAAVSGDVRRALDIGRRVVELLLQKEKQDVLKSLENVTNCDLDNVMNIPPQKKVVGIQQVVSVLNDVYGTTQTLNKDDMPLQQKLVICSLLLIIKKTSNKVVSVGKLHDVYKKICLKRNLHPVDQSEFVNLCSLIETRGILKIIKKKDLRLSKVNLEWDEEEVISILRDKLLLSSIIQDDSVLMK